MDANKGNIFELLNGLKQYIVPIYQRLYSWDESQYGRLWDDIVEMQKESRDSHFLGSIVCIAEKTAPTGVQKYMVIDGQHRFWAYQMAGYTTVKIYQNKPWVMPAAA